MEIRRAQVSDAPLLAKVHVDSWQVAYHGLIPDDFREKFTYARREEAFRRALTDGTEETYLAHEQGEALGILTLGASRDNDLDHDVTGEIWGIYLAPTCWRRGIGTQLFHEGERILIARGYREIVLWVLEGNADARRFYEKMGFSLDGAFKHLELGKTLKAVRYKKMVGAAETPGH